MDVYILFPVLSNPKEQTCSTTTSQTTCHFRAYGCGIIVCGTTSMLSSECYKTNEPITINRSQRVSSSILNINLPQKIYKLLLNVLNSYCYTQQHENDPSSGGTQTNDIHKRAIHFRKFHSFSSPCHFNNH